MAQVIVTVRPDGHADVKAEGWKGESCTTITEPFRKALGKEVAFMPTEEMFEQTQQQEINQ